MTKSFDFLENIFCKVGLYVVERYTDVSVNLNAAYCNF